MKGKINTLCLVLVCLAIIGGVTAAYLYLKKDTPSMEMAEHAAHRAEKKKEKKILYWRAPMDPTYISDKPGKSPMGMDLIPVYEGEEEEAGIVKIDPRVVQSIGVRTEKVERMPLRKNIRTVGRVDYDEKKLYHIHTKIDGWIEKLYVDYTGQLVKKDEMLLEIYSPQLVAAQEEYLLARRYSKEVKLEGIKEFDLLELSRRRLELWDVPPHQIEELDRTGTIMRTLHIHSPVKGIVVEKPVREGMFVKPGTKLYTIADLSTIWVYVDIYEYELPWIKAGDVAELTLTSQPGRTYRGRVSFVYPFMDPKTRTNKVRLEFSNPGFELKPDMYADVSIKASIRKESIVVPKEAVIRSGERNVVILSLGEGRFMAKEITLGVEGGEWYEVKEGLKEGDTVVVSAQFLIDSESRLKEAIGKMSGMHHH